MYFGKKLHVTFLPNHSHSFLQTRIFTHRWSTFHYRAKPGYPHHRASHSPLPLHYQPNPMFNIPSKPTDSQQPSEEAWEKGGMQDHLSNLHPPQRRKRHPILESETDTPPPNRVATRQLQSTPPPPNSFLSPVNTPQGQTIALSPFE